MPLFPHYEYAGPGQAHKLDLTNIPKECVTVTVNIKDEKLKTAIEKRIRVLKGALENAKQSEQWGVAHRVSQKLSVLEEVLKEAAV
jgi:hypothetical protein